MVKRWTDGEASDHLECLPDGILKAFLTGPFIRTPRVYEYVWEVSYKTCKNEKKVTRGHNIVADGWAEHPALMYNFTHTHV